MTFRASMHRPRVAALWIVTGFATLAPAIAPPARAAEPAAARESTASPAGAPSASAAADATSARDATSAPRPLDIPLTELPEPPPLSLPDPAPADLKALDALLERLTSPEQDTRERAAQELLEVKPRWVSALQFRLDAIAERSDKEAMKEVLTSVRRQAKESDEPAEAKRGKDESPDYLLLAIEHASPKKEAWQNLVKVLAISRMLGQIGTTPATRGIIRVYIRFGEFLRIDTQRQLSSLGDRALGALIETRRHPAQKVAQWAERQLDLTGKSIPSEAVQTEDQEALADVLLAFGRIRDPDSARIIISFAQSERAQIRNAARQAVVLLGDVATWQLRDAYENTVSKLPPREWTWQRTARELFTEYDRLRQAKEYELFEAGMAAQKQGDLGAMREKFDRVLAYNPMFERRDEMAHGYLDFARKVLEDKPEDALAALRRAERITGEEKERRVIQSLRRTLEARALLARGTADQGLLNQALALDPNNRLAEQSLASAAAGGKPALTNRTRYLVAGVIVGVSLLGALGIMFVALWRRRTHSAALAAPSPAIDIPSASHEPPPSDSPTPSDLSAPNAEPTETPAGSPTETPEAEAPATAETQAPETTSQHPHGDGEQDSGEGAGDKPPKSAG